MEEALVLVFWCFADCVEFLKAFVVWSREFSFLLGSVILFVLLLQTLYVFFDFSIYNF